MPITSHREPRERGPTVPGSVRIGKILGINSKKETAGIAFRGANF